MASKARLFYPDELKTGLISKLSKNQSHYIKNVMRLKPGDNISLFNSSNGEWEGIIINQKNDLTEFRIKKFFRNQKESKDLWLAFSPIKKNPQDMMLQKTTELGITKFIPVICERSVVREINIDRAKKIVIEASEQSNRTSIPELLKIQNLRDFLKKFPSNGKIIFCDINYKGEFLKNFLLSQGPSCILIGPEGDFSEKERQLIVDNNKTVSLSLSRNILRAETAAISATSILNHHLNFK